MIPVSEPTSSMFLPFVNANHLGAALVIFLPLLVGNLLDEGISGARSGAVLVAVTAIGALLLGCGSASAMLVGVGVVVLTLWHWSRRRLGFVVPSLVGGLVVALVFPYTNPHLLSRLPMWRDTLSLIADHPLTGVGAGSYGDAIESYRTDQFFLTWSHAHNEPLQFLAEFGAVGLVGLLLVFSFLRPHQDPREDPIRIRLLLGLLGLAMHSLVEFPLRLTSVALSGVVAWGVLLGLEQTPSARSERSIRRFLRTAAPLLLLGSGWLLRTQHVEKTVSAVRSEDRSVVLSEKQVLAWTAPWRGEEKLHRAWQSLQRNDTEKALGLAAQIRQEHPDDAGLLMRVSILQAKGGDLPGAGATIDRAAERNPWDYRPHVLAARLFFAGGDVEASAAAWTEAFYRQAPTALLPEAMKAQALGLWWVSALVDHSPVYSFTLAILLSEEDPKAARLAMDQAAYLAPDYYGHRAFHAELMRRSGDLRGAEAFPA
jgi:tetratricopeptide (TPR) repeat protein